MNAADVLVTDYSSVFFDFANTGRKIILYPYDYDTYIGERGLYTSLEDLPFPKVYSGEELAAELGRPKEYDDTEFRRTYCNYDNREAAVRLAKQVFLGEDVCRVEKWQNRETKKKILVFSSGMDHNGLTTSLLNVIKEAPPSVAERMSSWFAKRQIPRTSRVCVPQPEFSPPAEV